MLYKDKITDLILGVVLIALGVLIGTWIYFAVHTPAQAPFFCKPVTNGWQCD
jgi:hypothetical protein